MILAERVDEPLAQIVAVVARDAQAEVKVLGETSPVAEPDLHRHSALDDPATGLRPLESRYDTLEHDPTPKAIDREARLGGLVADPSFEGRAECLR